MCCDCDNDFGVMHACVYECDDSYIVCIYMHVYRDDSDDSDDGDINAFGLNDLHLYVIMCVIYD